MLSVKMDYKSVIAAALVGAGAVWLARQALKEGLEELGEVAKKVDPTDPENIINEWFSDAYSMVTGSPNQLGADLYDWLHQVEPEVYPPYEVPPQEPGDKDPRPDVWTGDIIDTRDIFGEPSEAKEPSGAGGAF